MARNRGRVIILFKRSSYSALPPCKTPLWKKVRAFLMVLPVFFVSASAQAQQLSWLWSPSPETGKKVSERPDSPRGPTFFDSLNQGREIVLTPGDFRAVDSSAKPYSGRPADSVSAFHVQFFASPEKSLAEKEKERIEETLGVHLTIIYESPYFKLRAGPYRTRAEAEDFRLKMQEAGHSSAWIIPAR